MDYLIDSGGFIIGGRRRRGMEGIGGLGKEGERERG